MHSIERFFIMPLTIFWLILLAGIVFYLLKHKRTGLIFGFFSILWLAIISFPLIPSLLVKSLEQQYQPLIETLQNQRNDTIFIIVLGGGHSEGNNLPPVDQLSSNSLHRLLEGIRLHKLLPASYLVFTGMTRGQKYSHAEIFRIAALTLGVVEKEISLLPTSENTRMEAFDFTNKFGTNNTLVLVTDAIHMPRAMLLFSKAGQSPIPAPTNYIAKSDYWGPSALNISKMENAMHELFGLFWAKIVVKSRK